MEGNISHPILYRSLVHPVVHCFAFSFIFREGDFLALLLLKTPGKGENHEEQAASLSGKQIQLY